MSAVALNQVKSLTEIKPEEDEEYLPIASYKPGPRTKSGKWCLQIELEDGRVVNCWNKFLAEVDEDGTIVKDEDGTIVGISHNANLSQQGEYLVLFPMSSGGNLGNYMAK